MSAPPESKDLLTSLLRDVSRSFYLTLQALPRPVRPQIGLAYLLARATDTIADTDLIPLAERLRTLQRLREEISNEGESAGGLDLGGFAGHAAPAERALLERMEEALRVLRALEREDQRRIRDVLSIITSGQELDLRRFAEASPDRVIALRDGSELEDYTYRVAGCVGEFWTRM